MFTTKVKADYRVPGLNYKREPGVLTGKLYTALPRRFKSAGMNAFRAGVVSFIGLWMLLGFAGDPDSLLNALIFSIVFLILSYPVFVIYDPGKRIKLTKDELRIGWKRFDLAHVSSFYKIPNYDSDDRIDGYCVGFRYGEREREIWVINGKSVIEGIIPFLNREREAIAREAPIAKAEEVAPSALRSAEF